MPCRDDRDNRDDPSYLNTQLNDHRKALKETEALLCEACTLLEEHHLAMQPHASPQLIQWYESHEECEKNRVRLEAALKLTERERRLLGINLVDLQAKANKKR
jgi:hypothetical protein